MVFRQGVLQAWVADLQYDLRWYESRHLNRHRTRSVAARTTINVSHAIVSEALAGAGNKLDWSEPIAGRWRCGLGESSALSCA